MFLQPSEVGFLKHLKEARVPVVEFDFPASKIVNVQSQLEKLIGQNYYLNKVSWTTVFVVPTRILTCHPVRQGRLPCLPPGLCIALTPLRFRRAQTRPGQGGQGLRLLDATPH